VDASVTHQAIDYQERVLPYAGGPVAAAWSDDRSSFDVPSACPACQGPMIRTVRRGLPTGSKSIWRPDRETPVHVPDRVTLICACGYPHPQRPADSTETGCGAAWKVPLA
jgi:hypothetical protein